MVVKKLKLLNDCKSYRRSNLIVVRFIFWNMYMLLLGIIDIINLF
jgi:hypothetical protein